LIVGFHDQSTAQKSGLIHVNDLLHAVEDTSVYNLDVAQVRELIIGDPDSEVNLWTTPGPRRASHEDGSQRPKSLPSSPEKNTSPGGTGPKSGKFSINSDICEHHRIRRICQQCREAAVAAQQM